jgi:hypothetical protein
MAESTLFTYGRTPVKEYKRLAAGIRLGNDPSGILHAEVVDFDGGDLDLHPRMIDNGLILVDPSRPHAYSLVLRGDADALERLGKALQAVARNLKKDGDSDDTPDE